MSKREFLEALRSKLAGLSQEEREKTMIYYSEMIEDRMEEGATEEEAVAAVGEFEDILAGVPHSSMPQPVPWEQPEPEPEIETEPKPKAEPVQPKSTKNNNSQLVKAIIILVSAPIWFPVVITVVSLLFSLVVTVFSLGVSLIGVGIGGFFSMIRFFVDGRIPQGFFMMGLGFAGTGIAILCIAGLTSLGKWCVNLCKKGFAKLKELVKGKEQTNE